MAEMAVTRPSRELDLGDIDRLDPLGGAFGLGSVDPGAAKRQSLGLGSVDPGAAKRQSLGCPLWES